MPKRSSKPKDSNSSRQELQREPLAEPTWEVGTVSELRRKYGLSLRNWHPQKLNEQIVPLPLRPLIPLAEFWGIPDDIVRVELIENAGESGVKELRQLLRPFIKVLEAWLCEKRKMATWSDTDEYVAFSCLVDASDGI